MVVEVKARGRSHSLAYVEAAQRRDRTPGPFRTYNLKVDRVLGGLAPDFSDLGACPSNGAGCENGACEARSRREEEVDVLPSTTTTNAEIVRNPHSPFGLQAASAHLLCSGSSTMAEHRQRCPALQLDQRRL